MAELVVWAAPVAPLGTSSGTLSLSQLLPVVGAGQEPLGEVHPLVQLGDLLPESVHFGQQLGVLRVGDPPPNPFGKGSADRADRKEEQGSASEQKSDGEQALH
jgi:hypothetical protein